jgi:hypothetical protein
MSTWAIVLFSTAFFACGIGCGFLLAAIGLGRR